MFPPAKPKSFASVSAICVCIINNTCCKKFAILRVCARKFPDKANNASTDFVCSIAPEVIFVNRNRLPGYGGIIERLCDAANGANTKGFVREPRR